MRGIYAKTTVDQTFVIDLDKTVSEIHLSNFISFFKTYFDISSFLCFSSF